MRDFLLVFSAMTLILIPLAASAATIHVPGDAPTIQAGIDSTAAGDTGLDTDLHVRDGGFS